MIKAVIFDFNGTMYFDDDKHVLSWREFAKNEFKVYIKDEDFDLHIHGFSNKEILKFLTGNDYTKDQIKDFATRKELYYQKICEEDKETLHLVAGLESFLLRLKNRGLKLAICTSSMKPNVDWYIKTFNLHRYFLDDLIIYDDGTIKKGKPDPEIYNRAIAALNIKSEECVVFEDAQSGIKSAFNAHVNSIIAVGNKEKTDKVKNMNGVFCCIEDFTSLPSSVENILFK